VYLLAVENASPALHICLTPESSTSIVYPSMDKLRWSCRIEMTGYGEHAPMSMDRDYEKTLIQIARVLPPNRVEQLVDFARFLESQSLTEELQRDKDLADVETDNAQWDTLLATEASQALLGKLADEALAEHRAGKTRPMAFDDKGRIIPG
jgi:hypothetical protein